MKTSPKHTVRGLSRRNFLKTSTAVAGGSLAAGLTVERAAFAAGDESRMFAQTRQIPACWNLGGALAHGTLGRADIVQGRIEGGTSWAFRGPRSNPYQTELDTLMDAIRRGQSRNDVEFAARSTMTAIMGRMASYSGQLVCWEDALKSEVKLAPEKYAFDAMPPVTADKNGIYPIAVPGVTKAV